MSVIGEAWAAELARIREAALRASAEIDASIIGCPLRSSTIRGVSRRECLELRVCFLCGDPLGKGRQRWCSDPCVAIYWRNHGWSVASHFAATRARLALASGVAAVASFPWHSFSDDEYWLIARDLSPQCERCGKRGEIEINHVVARAGGGYGEGCHHHQTNLEPLCHACHVAETTAQIRERRGMPLGGRNALPEPLWGSA